MNNGLQLPSSLTLRTTTTTSLQGLQLPPRSKDYNSHLALKNNAHIWFGRKLFTFHALNWTTNAPEGLQLHEQLLLRRRLKG